MVRPGNLKIQKPWRLPLSTNFQEMSTKKIKGKSVCSGDNLTRKYKLIEIEIALKRKTANVWRTVSIIRLDSKILNFAKKQCIAPYDGKFIFSLINCKRCNHVTNWILGTFWKYAERNLRLSLEDFISIALSRWLLLLSLRKEMGHRDSIKCIKLLLLKRVQSPDVLNQLNKWECRVSSNVKSEPDNRGKPNISQTKILLEGLLK